MPDEQQQIWNTLFRQAEARLAQAGAAPETPPVIDPPKMKPAWETEVDERLAKNNGVLELPLASGQVIRVVPEPNPNPAPGQPREISHTSFRHLIRCAAILGGRVTRVISREQHTAEIKDLIERGMGYWSSPGVFVEVDKEVPGAGSSEEQGDKIIAAPGTPDEYPALDPSKWVSIGAGDIIETKPMRLPDGKVIGSVLITNHGPVWVRKVAEGDERLRVVAEWAYGGAYTIDEEVFKKYLSDRSTVIKIVRGKSLYFTTSDWVQRFGGVVSSWGKAKVVMPLVGKYWLVTDEAGVRAEA